MAVFILVSLSGRRAISALSYLALTYIGPITTGDGQYGSMAK